VKRAFLFGLTVQLILISVTFLFLSDLMLPMTRSPLIGVVALCLAAVSGYFAWTATPHPSWLVKIGLWVAGFLAPHVVLIPL
jgi:hypothetical protein